jgi:ubiquinone/menaquinone biosynthesis C-methylase UbiE
VTASLSFDGLADLYDETRTVDSACLAAALDHIQQQFPPRSFPWVLEPGVGSGRIAIPLARRGYQVAGVDLSTDMLARLHERLTVLRVPLPIVYQQGDVTRLPFADGVFDLALPVHLFYFVQDWRRAADELLRVVKDTGALILMHTGSGLEVPALNERYQQMCVELGFPIPTVGARSTKDVVHYLAAERGCAAETIRDRWTWVQRIRLDRALGHLRDRAYSFTVFAPDAVHEAALATLTAETQRRHGDLSEVVEVPNQVYLVIVRRGRGERG